MHITPEHLAQWRELCETRAERHEQMKAELLECGMTLPQAIGDAHEAHEAQAARIAALTEALRNCEGWLTDAVSHQPNVDWGAADLYAIAARGRCRMNWDDELCGVKVTPEQWHGGIVAQPDSGRWGALYYGDRVGFSFVPRPGRSHLSGEEIVAMGGDWEIMPEEYDLIFPPRGWAGKTDVELAKEIFVIPQYRIDDSCLVWLTKNGPAVWFGLDCGIAGEPTATEVCYSADQLPALILALQNALVLARRLEAQP